MALTIRQPWCALIVHGSKRLETRSWPPPEKLIGRDLAIHAAGRSPMVSDVTPKERVAIERALGVPQGDWRQLPRSALIAVVSVRGAYRIAHMDNGKLSPAEVRGNLPKRGMHIENEVCFGDYQQGRWVWVLDNVRVISPMPYIGNQGIWPVRFKDAHHLLLE